MQEKVPDRPFMLAAVDGSLCAEVAAELLLPLARAEGSAVHGLYVVAESWVLDEYAGYQAELGTGITEEPMSRAQLLSWFELRGDSVLKWLEDRAIEQGVALHSDLLLGSTGDVVVSAAQGAQLIAMGRRGNRNAGTHDHLGSNFRAVAQRAGLPLLVGGEERRPLKRLLAVYEADAQAAPVFRWTARLQTAFDCQVIVLGISQDNASAPSTALAQALAENGLADCPLLWRAGDAADAIAATSAAQDADLIVLHGTLPPALLEWLVGSTLDRVLRSTERAVLAVT